MSLPAIKPSTETTFATVSIPDLRSQQYAMPEVSDQPKSEALATKSTRLEEIRSAIEISSAPKTATEVKPRVSGSWLSHLSAQDQEVRPLVESILENYPVGGTPVIGFMSSEINSQLGSTVARTSVALAEACESRILVIDSDIANGSLTYNLESVGRHGLAELINESKTMRDVILETSIANIDFLPLGRSAILDESCVGDWVRNSMPLVTSGYDYVLVGIGEAHERVATEWCNYSSGSYLLVSMTNSNQSVAKSAVTHLRNHGSRILGCILSDVSYVN